MDPNQLPLRDIHLPEAIGWWPLAPGWWILLVVFITGIIGLVFLWRKLTGKTVKKIARLELASLRNNMKLTTLEKVQALSVLLRRVCISSFPRNQAASLTGAAWLKFLDSHSKGQNFTQGAGKILVEAPYTRNINVDIECIFELCHDWIDNLPKKEK